MRRTDNDRYTYGNAKRLTYEARSKRPNVLVAKQRMSFGTIAVFLILVIGGMIGAGFLGAKIVADKAKINAPLEKNTVVYVDSRESGVAMTQPGEKMSAAGVYEAVSSSIVKISTGHSRSEIQNNIELNSGIGSGVVIGGEGEILTSYHVVKGVPQNDITVTMKNGLQYTVQSFKGDAVTDTAILKIDLDTKAIQAVVSNNFNISMAEELIMIGYPINSNSQIVSQGILSGVNEEVVVNNVDLDVERTTAAVNPGNSGGGVFNMYGALIGIANSRKTGETGAGISYFCRADRCLNVARQLIDNNYVKNRVDHNIIGFTEVTKTSSARPMIGLYVTRDDTGKSILNPNDYIVTVAGKTVTTREEWKRVLNSHIVNDTIDIVYMRGGNTYTAKLTLTQKKYCDN
ncbi:MAG TPA: S1C family serine protease [Clostridia bacterium]|nr:S1C family serine protease [Clostridia bacterium]